MYSKKIEIKSPPKKKSSSSTVQKKAETTKKEVTISTRNRRKFKLPKLNIKLPRIKITKKMAVRIGVFLAVLIILGVLVYVTIVSPALRVKASVDNIIGTFSVISTDLENKDLTKLETHTQNITSELHKINQEIDNYEFLKSLPATKGYYDNLAVLQRMNEKLSNLIDYTIPKLKPILASAGYKVEEGQSPEEEQEIAALLVQIPELLELYEEVEPQIIDLLNEFNNIDRNYVPTIGKYDFNRYIKIAQSLAVDLPVISEDIKAALRVIPNLLGVGKPAKYLVIFQNENEMRSSGGLITAFGNLEVKNGEFNEKIEAKDIWLLNNDLLNWGIFPPVYNQNGQQYLMISNNNRCGGLSTRPQDSGVYPDQYQTIEQFREYYDRARDHWKLQETYPKYDHIILMNTLFASRLISFVEPLKVDVFEGEVTSDNMARLLTYHLNTDAALGSVELGERKDFIKELATVTKDKVSQLGISSLPDILIAVFEEVQARHITLYSVDKDVQAYFDEMSFSGKIKTANDYKADYFHHSEAQYCALKSNFYVRNDVDMLVEIKDNNSIKKTVKVEWWNERYTEDTPDFIINPSGKFPYAVWSRMLVPDGTKFISSDSYNKSGYFYYYPKQYKDDKLKSYVLEHIVHFNQVRHKGEEVKRKDYTTQYELPDNIKYSDDKGYNLLLIKHAGKRSEKFDITIKYKGKSYSKVISLDQDKVVTFKNNAITVDEYDKRLDKFINYTAELKKFVQPESNKPGTHRVTSKDQ